MHTPDGRLDMSRELADDDGAEYDQEMRETLAMLGDLMAGAHASLC